MIAYLEGRVRDRDGTTLVLNCGGVGYQVTTCGTVEYGSDELVELFIHSITKETGTTLFGFGTRGARARFLELIGIKGVGPTTAMRVIAAKADPRNLAQLVAIKGVGQKTAEAIVAELGAAA